MHIQMETILLVTCYRNHAILIHERLPEMHESPS
jgi:hypothetical protein